MVQPASKRLVTEATIKDPASAPGAYLSTTFDAAVGGNKKSKVKTDGTDQTAALQAELDALRAAGGGTLVLPVGTVTVNGTLTLGNDGATPPKQPTLRILGQGAHWSGRGSAPVGATILDIKGTDTYGKIKTTGLGLLAITGVTFKDSAATSTPFLYTTNTTLHVDQCAFVGSKSGTACDQDAIICGGTVAIEGQGDPTQGFQGYGTVITRNFFSGTRRAVYGRVYFNANVIRDNTVWANCGFTTGAAIEIDGNPGADAGNPKAVGNLVAGNLIEVTNYKYGVKLANAVNNTVAANGMYDATATTTAGVRLDATAQFNRVDASFIVGTKPYIEEGAGATTTFLTSAQSVRSVMPGGLDVWQGVTVKDATGVGAAALTSDSTGKLRIAGGTQILANDATSMQLGPTTNPLTIGTLGTADVWVDAAAAGSNANINLKLRAKGTGTIQPQSSIVMTGSTFFRVATYATASRPGASAAGKGGMVYDSDLNKPIWSDGTAWRDASGTVV